MAGDTAIKMHLQLGFMAGFELAVELEADVSFSCSASHLSSP
jgi:hypothetical protein